MSKSRLILVAALSLMTLQAWAADKSLVLYLPFDEGAGTTAKDLSSYNNPGTVVGAATWVTGAKGTALQFVNGSRVTIPEIPQYDVTAEVSLLAWVKATTVPNWGRVIDKSRYQTSGFDLVLTQNVGLPRLEFFVNNTTSSVDGTTVVANNEWHFIVGTFGNKTLRVYVDGERQGQTQSAGLVDINPNDLALMVGGESSSNGGQQFLGSIDEVAMYNRELSASEVMKIFQNGMASPESAADPEPQNEAVDVPREAVLGWTPGEFAASHDVYFGTSLEAVGNASRTSPSSVLASRGQDANSYDPPGRLEFGQTYYWRVDEVNAAPDFTIFKGGVWSFTVEPYSYAVTGVTATASSSHLATTGPEQTVNGSGLNSNDQHGVDMKTTWLSNKKGPQPTWIQYALPQVCQLDKMLVWNSNQAAEQTVGFGAKDVTIEYSVDGTTWTALGDFEFAQASGEDTYTANTVVDFGLRAVKYVKLTINSNWGGIFMQYGLSEVRFLQVPTAAREPSPAQGATNVHPQVPLSWRAGREAASHEVYLSTDPNNLVLAGTVAAPSYDVATDLLKTYYWKVVEVNTAEDPAKWESSVWSFTTAEYITIDDFESYTNSSPKRVFQSWVDGTGFSPDEFFPNGNSGNGSGALVGYDPTAGNVMETVLIHGGAQSMPLYYDNSGGTRYSEAQRTFATPQDWTKHTITTLVIWFRGDPNNVAAPLYAKINDTKVVYNNGAASTAFPLWKQWSIPLSSVSGANLKSVKTLAIGIGDGKAGGTGTIFIDDIRLYATAPQIVTPADPGTSNLVALYAMEGNVQDTSGKANNGTTSGDPGYVQGPISMGKVMQFDGTNDYVDLPIGSLLSTLSNITVATWANFSNTGGDWQRIFDFGTGETNYMFLTPKRGATGSMRFAIRTATVSEQVLNARAPLPSGWHHVAVVMNGATMTMQMYVDGVMVRSVATTLLPKDLGVTTQNWLGRSQFAVDAFYTGLLDDFRVYNRALSESEVRYLVGDR